MPVFNGGASLGRALASALDQVGVRMHLVVIDHGSTDNSVDIAKRARTHGWVDVLHVHRASRERRSASRPLNRGLDHLRGRAHADDWVVRLDSDDAFAKQDSVCSAIDGADALVVCAFMTLYDQTGRCRPYGPSAAFQNRASLLTGGAYALAHHATLVRCGVLERLSSVAPGLLVDPRLGYGEDLDLSMRVLEAVRDDDVLFRDVTIMLKSLGPGSVSSSLPTRKIFLDHVRIFNRHRSLPRSLLFHVLLDLLAREIPRLHRLLRRTIGAPADRFTLDGQTSSADVTARLAVLKSQSDDLGL